jgi:hypothetical protein
MTWHTCRYKNTIFTVAMLMKNLEVASQTNGMETREKEKR